MAFANIVGGYTEMDGRFKQQSGDSYSVQCEVCRKVFDTVIRTKDDVDLCFRCYQNRFGKEVLKNAMKNLSHDRQHSGWDPIEEERLNVSKELLDMAYEIFLQRNKLKTVFDRMPKTGIQFSEEDKMRAGSLLMSVRELTLDQINTITNEMEDDHESIRKLNEICESDNQYMLKQNYGICSRCSIRPLNKPRQSRTETNQTICNVCATNEILTDISSRPEMSLQDYDDFYKSVENDLPSRNFEFCHRIFQDEKDKETPNQFLENIMRQRLHDLERHPTDTKGWCNYCEMFYRESVMPKEVRNILTSCPNCIDIAKRQTLTNEQIALTIRKHIKKQHREIYKTVTAQDSNFFQWDFITPEEDERRRFTQWRALNPTNDPEEYVRARDDFVKNHYLLSSEKSVEEDPERIFPSLVGYEKSSRNPEIFEKARIEHRLKKGKDFEDHIAKELVIEFHNFLETNKDHLESKDQEEDLTKILHATTIKVLSKYPLLTKDQEDRVIKLTEEAIGDAIRNQIKNDNQDKMKPKEIEKYKQATNWVIQLSKGSNDIQNDLRLKGGSEKWINSLKNRVISMTEEERIQLIADLMENFKTISKGELILHRILPVHFSIEMANCDKCRELIIGKEFKRITQENLDIQYREHVIENHPESCLFVGRGTDYGFSSSIYLKSKDIERLISHEIIKEIHDEPNTSKRITVKEVYDDLNRVSKRVFAKYPELTNEQIKKIVIMTDNITKESMEETRSMEEARNKTNTVKETQVPRNVVHERKSPIKVTEIEEEMIEEWEPEPEQKPEQEKLDFEDFKNFLKERGILNRIDFENYQKAEINKTIPKSPESFYKKDGWKGWKDATGFIPKKPAMTQEVIDQIKEHIRDNWDYYVGLEEGFIIWVFDQWGVFGIKDPMQRAIFNEFVHWKDIPKKRNAIWEYLNLNDTKIIEEKIITSADKKVETRDEFLSRQFSTSVKDVPLFDSKKESIQEIIQKSDHYTPTMKNDKINRFMRLKFIKNIWTSFFDYPKQDLSSLHRNGLEFHDRVIDDFQKQYDSVTDDFNPHWKQYVKFYKFRGKPSLMQRYGAFMLLTVQGLLNMFGTGTGKTLTAILGSKVINAKHVFWICPKNTIDQSRRMIEEAFPEVSEVTTVLDNPKEKTIPLEFFEDPSKTGHMFKKNGKYITKYHLINYEQFSLKRNAERLLNQLLGKKIQLFVLDESQMVKNSNESEEKSSIRRKNIITLLNDLRIQNPNMRVLMLSATPIVNNVAEFMSMYKMISGTDLLKHGMSTYTNIRNGARMFAEIQPFSIRYEAKYDIEVLQPIVECAGYLPDEMSDETARETSWIDFESFLTEIRTPFMLKKMREIREKNPDEKFVIYTHYVSSGIVDQLQIAFRNAGYRVGLFTGEDKTGWIEEKGVNEEGKRIYGEPFKEGKLDVLIASRTFQVGVDGAQGVCRNIFFNGFVWTDTEFEQTKGRLVRSGQDSKRVYVHMFFATVNGFKYDHEVKYLRVLRKRALGDLCRDGRLPKDVSLGEKKEKENAIEKILVNRRSGFPTKEALNQMHSEEAQREVKTQLEELKKQYPNANFDLDKIGESKND